MKCSFEKILKQVWNDDTKYNYSWFCSVSEIIVLTLANYKVILKRMMKRSGSRTVLCGWL